MESVLFASTLDQEEEAIVARVLKPTAHGVVLTTSKE